MWNGVVTNVGLALLEQWSAGSQTLNIDQATIGTGTVPQANLRASTSVIGEVGPVSIVSSSAVTNGTAYRIQVQPASDAPYVGHQIGIWGSLAGGSSTLLAIYQDEDGVIVPLAADSPGFVFTLYAIVTMSNDGSMTVNTDGGAYITQDYFSTALSGIEQSIATINGDLDGKKFYNSVTDLGLTAGSATLTDVWSAMVNNSMGVFTGDDFPMSELPGSSQRGIVIVHRLLTSRGMILWVSKTQTDGTKNQLCVMQWTGNSPSGVWRDVADLGLAYAAGDTYAEAASSSARNVVPGLIAGSAKQILFRVTTPKSMANISNISVTALTGWFAGINGIIKDSNGASAADNTNWLSQNGVAVAAYKKSDNTAIIRLTCESALGNATNGPCNGMLAFALSFS